MQMLFYLDKHFRLDMTLDPGGEDRNNMQMFLEGISQAYCYFLLGCGHNEAAATSRSRAGLCRVHRPPHLLENETRSGTRVRVCACACVRGAFASSSGGEGRRGGEKHAAST